MNGVFKEAFTVKGSCKQAKRAFEKKSKKDTKFAKGINGDPLWEPVPEYIQTSSEEVIKNDNNAWIVLGRDRPQNRGSGYGGRGDTQAASVDIVVGRMGASVVSCIDEQKVWINPDFKKDAARIYISQKTDIDANFGLAAGKVGSAMSVSEHAESKHIVDPSAYHDWDKHLTPSVMKPVPRSGIALKADDIRIIAREGIKLVTGTDAKNSQDGDVASVVGIDLIAGNNAESIEAMVKGGRLITALKRIVFHLNNCFGALDTFVQHQTAFNESITNHQHTSPFWGSLTTISPPIVYQGTKTGIDLLSQTKRSIAGSMRNLGNYEANYLDSGGDGYINSKWNHVN
jgi:hypothetical protein